MGPGHLAHVNVASGVDADAVGRDEPARRPTLGLAAQPGLQIAPGVVDGHPRPQVGGLKVGADGHAQLADVGALGGLVDVEAAGTGHVHPLRLKLAVGIEHLHPVVLPVGHEHPAVLVGADVVGDVEAAGVGARRAPRKEVGAVGGILVHPRVAVAVGNVEVAVARVDGDVGAAVEGVAAHKGRRLPADAQGEQHRAVQLALADGMVAVVAQEHGVVGGHGNAVSAGVHALAP